MSCLTIVSSWRSTATATSARSTALRGADRRYVLAVNIKPHTHGIIAREPKSGRRLLFLHLAVLGLGATMLVGCAEEPPPPPPETAAVPPPQQPAPKAPSHVARRPAHKPTPPPA